MTKPASTAEDLKVYAVTEGGKIYWAKRNARGQFCRADGRNRADLISEEYGAYLEARIAQAEQETRGNVLNDRAWAAWVSVEQVLTGRRSVRRWGTSELQDWITLRGRTLLISEFRAQFLRAA